MVAKKSSTDETAAEGKQLSLLTDVADGIVVPIMQSVNKYLRLVWRWGCNATTKPAPPIDVFMLSGRCNCKV